MALKINCKMVSVRETLKCTNTYKIIYVSNLWAQLKFISHKLKYLLTPLESSHPSTIS